jgi:hypothetical protein
MLVSTNIYEHDLSKMLQIISPHYNHHVLYAFCPNFALEVCQGEGREIRQLAKRQRVFPITPVQSSSCRAVAAQVPDTRHVK